MNKRNKNILFLLILAVLFSVLVSANLGAAFITWQDFMASFGKLFSAFNFNHKDIILFNIRFPRVIGAALVGSILALAGTSIQGVFKNPLADPSIIGISAGAALSAAVVIVILSSLVSFAAWGGLSVLSLTTFVGAFFTAWLVFKIAQHHKKTNIATLLLAGIAINAFSGAIMGALIYSANDVQLRSITFWTMGSLGGLNWTQLGILSIAAIVCWIFLVPIGKSLNALALGENEAFLMGVSSEKIKRRVIVISSIAVGSTVAFCGMIGFVGLVVPHILRLWIGPDHRFLLPASALGGALLLIWADTFARTIVAPTELPIGILTSAIGAPLFLYLLIQQKKQLL